MGDKMQGLNALLEKRKKTDPAVGFVGKLRDLLARPYYISDPDDLDARVFPDDALATAEHILHLRDLKDLFSQLSSTAGEAVEEAQVHLYEIMSTKGPTLFTHKGQRFALSSTTYAQARKELGGTENPELKALIAELGMTKIAAGAINATSLKSGVNKWMEQNPIEASKQVGDDMIDVHGDELIDALGLADMTESTYDDAGNLTGEVVVTAAEQLERRRAYHARLHELMLITSKPTISVTKS